MTSEEFKIAMIEAKERGKSQRIFRLMVERTEELSRKMLISEYTSLEKPSLLAAAITIEKLYRNTFEQDPAIIEIAEALADSVEILAAEIKFRPEDFKK